MNQVSLKIEQWYAGTTVLWDDLHLTPYTVSEAWIPGGNFEGDAAEGWSSGAPSTLERLFGERSLRVVNDEAFFRARTISPRLPVESYADLGLWVKGEFVYVSFTFLDADDNPVGGRVAGGIRATTCGRSSPRGSTERCPRTRRGSRSASNR